MCEENLSKEKFKKQQQIHDELSQKFESLQKELSHLKLGRKEPMIKHKYQGKKSELFPNATKDDLISENDLRSKKQ